MILGKRIQLTMIHWRRYFSVIILQVIINTIIICWFGFLQIIKSIFFPPFVLLYPISYKACLQLFFLILTVPSLMLESNVLKIWKHTGSLSCNCLGFQNYLNFHLPTILLCMFFNHLFGLLVCCWVHQLCYCRTKFFKCWSFLFFILCLLLW